MISYTAGKNNKNYGRLKKGASGPLIPQPAGLFSFTDLNNR